MTKQQISEAYFQRICKLRNEVGGIENLMELVSLANSKGAVISAVCKVYGWKQVGQYIANMVQEQEPGFSVAVSAVSGRWPTSRGRGRRLDHD